MGKPVLRDEVRTPGLSNRRRGMNEQATAMHTAPVRSSHLVVDDFMPSDIAREMRAAAEAHFGSPYHHSPKTHMNWDYWHVPGLYTYLRTLPEKVIGPVLTEAL